MAQRGMGLVQFRAHKETILDLKKKGYSKKLVYQALEDKFEISYCQFTRLWDKEFRVTTAKKKISPERNSERDPFRQQRKPIHNPTMTDERRKQLF